MIKRSMYLSSVSMALLLSIHPSAGISEAALQTSTTMTVVDIDKEELNEPSPEEYTAKDAVLLNVDISYAAGGKVVWSWDSPWNPSFPDLADNNLSARIWSIECHLDDGKKCKATSWDWVEEITTFKGLEKGKFKGDKVGFMFTTVCGTSQPAPEGTKYKTCSVWQPKPQRSNIMFTKNPL